MRRYAGVCRRHGVFVLEWRNATLRLELRPKCEEIWLVLLLEICGSRSPQRLALAEQSKNGWEEDELFPVGKSADAFNFTAYPAGCMEEFGFCGARGRHTRFWSSVGRNKWAYRVCLDNFYDDAVLDRFWNDFSCANSIRCVKDC